MSTFVQGVFSGIALGSIYSLIALGYNIIYSTMRMGHFAQGDFFMFGGILGYQTLVRWGQNLFISFAVAIIGTSLLMLVAERLAYRAMYTREGVGLMLSTMGMQFVVQWIVKIVWGTEGKKMPPMFGTENQTFDIKMFGDEVHIAHSELIIIGICGVLMILLAIFMKYTKVGVAMNAVSMNNKAAQLMGVKLTTIISSTYILAAAMAAFAGVLMAPRFSVNFNTGIAPGNRAMTAAVLGGFGSMPGAMLGGVLMGIIETLGAYYISTALRDVFTFVVLVAILLWRPQGVLGQKSITKV